MEQDFNIKKYLKKIAKFNMYNRDITINPRYVRDDSNLSDNAQFEINWSGIGATEPSKAKDYAKKILKASRIAKNASLHLTNKEYLDKYSDTFHRLRIKLAKKNGLL